MKTQEHTAGPWRVVPSKWDTDVDIRGPLDGKGASIYIATMSDVNERDDNARLIAAAPQLLEALQLVDLHFQRNLASDNFQGDDEHEAWNAVRNAIKSAKGEL